MVTILLFHHVQGLTPGLMAFADALRAEGHEVHTPDFFDGQTFDSIDEGFAYAESGAVDRDARADKAAAALPTDIVYAGFSYGVMSAQRLAQTRPGARGVLLFEACVPVTGEWAFGPWPAGLPAQIHGMDANEFFAGEGGVDAARDIAELDDAAELFLYPGDRHIFADSSLRNFDAGAAALLTERVLEFLRSVDAAAIAR